MAGHADDVKGGKLLPDPFHQFHAIHLGHADVGDQDGEGALLQQREGFFPVGGRYRLVSQDLDQPGDHPHNGFLVIDDQNAFLVHVDASSLQISRETVLPDRIVFSERNFNKKTTRM
jgi:hypothetical protein